MDIEEMRGAISIIRNLGVTNYNIPRDVRFGADGKVVSSQQSDFLVWTTPDGERFTTHSIAELRDQLVMLAERGALTFR